MTADRQAVISLLGLIWHHLDDSPGAVQVAKAQWESEPSKLDGPPAPLLLPNPACDGRCKRCIERLKKPVCPPEETLFRVRDVLRRRYRIGAVESALVALGDYSLPMAQAVVAEWVEPWPDPKTAPLSPIVKVTNRALANKGLDWICNQIRGEVIGFGESRESTNNRIRGFLARGWSVNRICKQLHVGHERIKRIQGGQ